MEQNREMNSNVIRLEDYKTASEPAVETPEERKANRLLNAKEKRKRKFQTKFKIVASAVALVAFLFLLGCTPVFQVHNIRVEGSMSLPSAKVVSLSGIHEGQNIFFLNTWKAKHALKKNPFVLKVAIHRTLPDTVTISITERKSVGYIVTTDGYVQVGEDGRFLAIQQSLNNYALPVISGIELSELPPIGGYIKNAKLQSALSVLQNCDKSLLDNIAELNVGQDHYILAYTNQQLEIRLGDLNNIEQRLAELNEILTNVVGTTVAADRILYIDMRYEGSPVIKLR